RADGLGPGVALRLIRAEPRIGQQRSDRPAVACSAVPRALITGITGQDGRHLAGLLVGKGYDVHGMVRGQNNPKIQMVQDETPELEIIEGDLQDLSSLIAVVEQVQPDEVYNLGAVSFVALSFRQPELTADISGA